MIIVKIHIFSFKLSKNSLDIYKSFLSGHNSIKISDFIILVNMIKIGKRVRPKLNKNLERVEKCLIKLFKQLSKFLKLGLKLSLKIKKLLIRGISSNDLQLNEWIILKEEIIMIE